LTPLAFSNRCAISFVAADQSVVKKSAGSVARRWCVDPAERIVLVQKQHKAAGILSTGSAFR